MSYFERMKHSELSLYLLGSSRKIISHGLCGDLELAHYVSWQKIRYKNGVIKPKAKSQKPKAKSQKPTGNQSSKSVFPVRGNYFV